MKILSCNVQGLRHRLVLKEMLKKNKINFDMIQETKIRSMSHKVVKELWVSLHVKWKALDAIGLASGILLLWDNCFIFVMNSWSGEFSVSMVVEDLVRNCKWMATSVNGPSNYQRRVCLRS